MYWVQVHHGLRTGSTVSLADGASTA